MKQFCLLFLLKVRRGDKTLSILRNKEAFLPLLCHTGNVKNYG
jgi:hypothetical protein